MARLDEKGISLVEILAALLLVSVIVAAAWTALTIGMKHTAVETSKTEIQQDANIIISKLSAVHRQSERVNIKFQNNLMWVQTCTQTVCNGFETVLDKEYDFTGSIINGNADLTVESMIEPKKNHANIYLNLNKNGRSLSIQTTLTRIRTDRP